MNKFSRIDQLTPIETDYHQWSVEQARLLRENRLDQIDKKHLAEEIENLGRSEKREIESRLEQILIHLLKWKYQSERRSKSWELTLKVQRDDLQDVLIDNPSLKDYPLSKLKKVYLKARLTTERETGLALETFPEECPFSYVEIVDTAFLPNE